MKRPTICLLSAMIALLLGVVRAPAAELPALQDAAKRGDIDAVRTLLDNGAEADAMDTVGATPLHVAAFDGHADIASLFVEKGADLTARTTKFGYTPLHAAAKEGCADIVLMLIDSGADLHAPRSDGNSALELAERQGHAEVADVLKKAMSR